MTDREITTAWLGQFEAALAEARQRAITTIQHAAAALWPASDEANRPIRKTFAIPLNRAMGL